MYTETEKQSFSWGNLIIGIVFILASLIAFKNPLTDLIALSIMFGATAIVDGAWAIMNRNGSITKVIVGILSVIIGIVFLFNLGLTTIIMPFLFAVWFITSSISGLFVANSIYLFSKSLYWFALVLSIVGFVIGCMLLFDPIASALTLAFLVGAYFMFTGIKFIVLAFRGE